MKNYINKTNAYAVAIRTAATHSKCGVYVASPGNQPGRNTTVALRV